MLHLNASLILTLCVFLSLCSSVSAQQELPPFDLKTGNAAVAANTFACDLAFFTIPQPIVVFHT